MKKKDLLLWVERLPEDAIIEFCSRHEEDFICAVEAANIQIAKITNTEMNEKLDATK